MKDLSIDISKNIIINPVEIILQQIDILFDTLPGEVLGEETFGVDCHQFLYDLKISNYRIQQYIHNKITSNVELFDYTCNVEVYILDGSYNDIIMVNINIKNDENSFEKTYKIQ